MEITRREILASVSIIAVMLLIGLLISAKISEAQVDRNEIYSKAVKIENQELFQYGMNTNVGYAFVYGDLEAVDTVTYPEIGGEYMYIMKVEEHYIMHTETYTTTDSKGHTQVHTRIYWSWDTVGRDEKSCKKITFSGVEFDLKKINVPSSSYITTVKKSGFVRFRYYGCETKYTGTILTQLKDKTISDKTDFYNNKTIKETVEMLESGIGGLVFFWILWTLLICGCVYGFCYLENRWLE